VLFERRISIKKKEKERKSGRNKLGDWSKRPFFKFETIHKKSENRTKRAVPPDRRRFNRAKNPYPRFFPPFATLAPDHTDRRRRVHLRRQRRRKIAS
jgi:hypothetical protein